MLYARDICTQDILQHFYLLFLRSEPFFILFRQFKGFLYC